MPFGDEQCQQMLKYNRSSPLLTILTDACGRDDELIVIITAKERPFLDHCLALMIMLDLSISQLLSPQSINTTVHSISPSQLSPYSGLVLRFISQVVTGPFERHDQPFSAYPILLEYPCPNTRHTIRNCI